MTPHRILVQSINELEKVIADTLTAARMARDAAIAELDAISDDRRFALVHRLHMAGDDLLRTTPVVEDPEPPF